MVGGIPFRVYYVNTIGCTSPSSCSHPRSLPCTAQEGRVTIDGVDVASLDGAHLRGELIAVVPQEPVLLSGSLRENIAIGRPSASEEEVEEAARRAGCDFAEANWEREVRNVM